MKKVSFKLMIALAGALMMIFSVSCKEDDPEPTPPPGDGKPVLGEDFSFTVTGNTVDFSTSLTGNVWFRNETLEKDHTVDGGSVSVFISTAGTYSFTCNQLVGGATVSSVPFDVVIDSDDLSYLDEGLWLYLSGGAGNTKTWKLDLNAAGECVYFDGPMYFSGDADYPYWAWDVLPEELPYTLENGAEQTGFFNWSPGYADNSWIMAANDYGTITFSGNDLTASTEIFGAVTDGSFEFDTATWKLSLTGVNLPLDTSRVNEGQYEVEDLANVRIFTLTDSSMQIGVKRSYEGGNPSPWVNVYNFIVDGYEYPVEEVEEFTYTGAPKTSVTAADLVGTWKYAEIAFGWIAFEKNGTWGTFEPLRFLEKWENRDSMVVALRDGWGFANIEDTLTKMDTYTYVFNGDGTCVLNGVSNTYTVADGVITLGTALAETEFAVSQPDTWLNNYFTGTEITIVDVTKRGGATDYEDYTPEGYWLGQPNAEQTQYVGFQIVKQP